MDALDLLRHLRDAGLVVRLTLDGGLHVAPRDALTDAHRAAIRAGRESLLVALQAEQEAFDERAAIMQFDGGLPRAEAEVAARQCIHCEFFGRRQTCLEPALAGLLTPTEGFGIVWSPDGQAAGCAAFSAKAKGLKQDRAFWPTDGTAAGHPDALQEFQARCERSPSQPRN